MKKVGMLMMICLLGVTGYWLNQHLAWQTRYVKEPMARHVQRNERYAAAKVLQQLQRRTYSADNRAELRHLPAQAVLLLDDSWTYTLDEQDQHLLMQWIRQGGHLIVSYSDTDFLKPLGIRYGKSLRSENQYKQQTEQERFRCLANAFIIDRAAPTPSLWLSDQTIERALISNQSANSMWGGKDQQIVIDQSIGKGFITVLAFNTWLFSNEQIGELDHAVMLYELTALHYPDSAVYFNTAMEDVSLLGWLYTRTPTVLISLALLIGLWLWYVIPRFGTLLPSQTHARRGLQEHMLASGFYLWRQKAFHRLHQSTCDRVHQRIRRRHPDIAIMRREQQWQALAERSGLSSHEIQQALHVVPSDKKSLVIAMRRLQQLYRLL